MHKYREAALLAGISILLSVNSTLAEQTAEKKRVVESLQDSSPTPTAVDQERKVVNGPVYRVPFGSSDGMEDTLPKTYRLQPLAIKQTVASACLRINANGTPELTISSEYGPLIGQKKETITRLLGSPLPSSKDDPAHYIVFEQLGTCFSDGGIVGGSSRNIYHIDTQFNAREELTNYRIRGFGISNPSWK